MRYIRPLSIWCSTFLLFAAVFGVTGDKKKPPVPGKKSVKNRAVANGVRQMEIRLPVAGKKERGSPLVESKVIADRSQPQHGDQLTEEHLVIKALDAKGKLLDKYYRRDPRLVRSEGLLQPKPQSSKVVESNSALLLDIPNRPDTAVLEIYKPKWNGKTFDLTLIEKIQVPQEEVKPAAKHRRVGSVAKVETIIKNGPPEKSVDIVIAGDGYTAAQMGKWRSDADNLIKQLMNVPPYSQYKNRFNVHRIDVASDEEGAGWIGPESKRNAFGSHFNCYNTERLLCVDNAEVNRIFHSLLSENQMDIKIVIANDSRYGGAGGEIATASTHADSFQVLIHEIGHSFGGLADEYGGGERDCDFSREPAEPNVTLQKNPQLVKWKGIPDTGVFEGGKYCDKGFYRPYENSLMRSLGQPLGELHLRILRDRIERITGASTGGSGEDVIVQEEQQEPVVEEPKREEPKKPDMKKQDPKRPEPKHEEPKKDSGRKGRFKPNDTVLLNWEDGFWYAAKIARIDGNDVTMTWIDDGEEFVLDLKQVRRDQWKAGKNVECIAESVGDFYPAVISSRSGTKAVIQWEDGGQSETVSIGACRSSD